MNRHHAAILILAAWVGALGWLAYRELFVARGPGASGWPVPPGSSFQAIRLGRRQIGVATLTVDTIPGGLRVVELTTVDLPADGSTAPRRTTQRVESLYSRKLALLSWDIDMLTEHGRERAGGRIIGDSVMTVVQAGAGQPPETLTVRVPGAVVLPGAVTLAVAAHGLPHHGMLYEFQVFDPLELAVRAVRYTAQQESLFTMADSAEFNPAIRRWVVAHADTVRAWRLDGIEYGLPVSRWTDAAGQPVRVTYPLGATMERSAFELVNTNFRSSPPPVWDHGPTVPAYPRRESDAPPEQFRWVALRLEPPEQLPAVLPALDGGFQRRSADTLYPALPSDTLPPATPAESRSPLLEADSMVQALAGELNATDPGNRARMLEARLRRAVRLRSGPVTSPATAVLRRGTGTEAERALVVVAIARETGLAARRAWGLCWQDGAWQVRPWAEIWNDGWMPVDVGAGARPGDRVRLGIGGGGRQLDLAIRAGRLRLEFARGDE